MRPILSSRVSSALCGLAAVAALACGPRVRVVKQPAMTAATAIAPDFTAVDHRGNTISLADENRESTVVLVFYRGAW